ncbi:hypothetical protein GCM10022253_28230 [Sphingomonas endophytica]|uniref:MFS transporter n=1 Tax=Sphingomonas endophytica TaxID=869719 RepID=A0ABR6N8J7_9SPHN|nr:hypothetical protein [Sphingomonas endophytica]MBB5727128.1 hypothetical protein [Sphingomonas endophytica]
MRHVTAAAPRRHDRARAAPPIPPHRARRASRLTPLDVVSLQAIAGFLGPLPVIQLGHLLFGWPSVTVMFGGQG